MSDVVDDMDASSPACERSMETAGGLLVTLGRLRAEEGPVLFGLFAGIVARGEGYPQAPPLSDADFDAAWGSGAKAVVAARHHRRLVGAYYLKPNYPGRAAHIANAGYVVDPTWRGRGLGRVLVQDSLREAAQLGFDAVQFNLVFASNPARRMYEELGFVVTGRVPAAVEGEDAFIYWRAL